MATMKLRLCRMFLFLGFCGISRILVLILIIHILPKFIVIISTINQPESQQHWNCRLITRPAFGHVKMLFVLKFLIGLTKNKSTLLIRE